MSPPTILLTGASGFVGRHVAVALAAAGFRVRGLSRSVRRARRIVPDIDWLEGDIEAPRDVEAALAGVTAAVYLYHSIGETATYAERECQVAQTFQQAAARSGVNRIVYLGGVVPPGPTSRHLESRRATGNILRSNGVVAIELRASMVIGTPSASFGLIRDLAVRLPLLALPPWLDNESCPISISDVAPAIALACRLPLDASAWFELPGPQCLSHRKLLELLTGPLGTRLIERRVAAIVPGVAALAVALISRVRSALSRELVASLESDLRPTGPSFWEQIGNPSLRPLRQAIADALCDEQAKESPSPATRCRIATTTVEWLEQSGVLVNA